MKMIVCVALLALAGCGSKKSSESSECEVAIGKGLASYADKIKSMSPTPQAQEGRLAMIDRLRGTLTKRCTEDKWPPNVVTCFSTVESMRDIQTCQARLSDEQRTKLMTEIRQVMMSVRGSMGMPPGVPGHPPMLGGSASGSGASQPPGSGGPAAPGESGAPAGSAAPPAGPAAPAAPAAGTTPPPSATAGSGTPPATGGKLR
ncbi:MAG TPA: hypothetical protein VFT22_04845 [Kofleriaceae bacterium]|nr:hypothetical protein [Kofleriaceae bacterium]